MWNCGCRPVADGRGAREIRSRAVIGTTHTVAPNAGSHSLDARPDQAIPLPARRKAKGQESGVLPRTLKARSRPGDTTLQQHASVFDKQRGSRRQHCGVHARTQGPRLAGRHGRGRRARHRRAFEHPDARLAAGDEHRHLEHSEGQARQRHRHPGQAGPVQRQALRERVTATCR